MNTFTRKAQNYTEQKRNLQSTVLAYYADTNYRTMSYRGLNTAISVTFNCLIPFADELIWDAESGLQLLVEWWSCLISKVIDAGLGGVDTQTAVRNFYHSFNSWRDRSQHSSCGFCELLVLQNIYTHNKKIMISNKYHNFLFNQQTKQEVTEYRNVACTYYCFSSKSSEKKRDGDAVAWKPARK